MRFSNRMLMLIGVALYALLVSACTSTGPGAECDPCAQAEAKPAGDNAAAAAAGAKGGQSASQAAALDDTARINPQTTIGRGTGNTSASSANRETRHGVTGGAQNAALVVPTNAEASASTGGGVSAAVQSARANVETWRASLAMAMTDSPIDMAKLEFIRTNLQAAQADLNAAEAAQASLRPNVTHNYFPNQQGSNTVFAVSSSSTDGKPNDEAVESAKAGVVGVVEATNAESSALPAGADAPDAPSGEGE